MVKKGGRLFLGLLLMATLAGCASSSPSASVGPADVNGTWIGGPSLGAATYTLVLKQTGTKVTGTLSGAGTMDGPVQGTVDGNTIRLTEESGYSVTPFLNVKGDQISGVIRGQTLTLRRTR
jgi:hypothetical protein